MHAAPPPECELRSSRPLDLSRLIPRRKPYFLDAPRAPEQVVSAKTERRKLARKRQQDALETGVGMRANYDPRKRSPPTRALKWTFRGRFERSSCTWEFVYQARTCSVCEKPRS